MRRHYPFIWLLLAPLFLRAEAEPSLSGIQLQNLEQAKPEQSSGLSNVVSVAEIRISGNGVDIPDNDTMPREADHTHFGATYTDGGTISRVFSIMSDGEVPVQLLGSPVVLVSGSSAFEVTQEPAGTSVLTGSPDSFEISFYPPTPGDHSATVSILSNDPDSSPYEFVIRGTGLEVQYPDMRIRGNGVVISHGDTTPTPADHTDFGIGLIGEESVSRNFSISSDNETSVWLHGSPPVTLSGSSAFRITQQPPGGYVGSGFPGSLQISFDPETHGEHTATVSIPNNTLHNNPYSFVIRGTALEAPGFLVRPKSQLVRPGYLAGFVAEAYAQGPVSYQWKKGAAVIPGATGGSYTIPVTKAADVAAYSVVATQVAGGPRVSSTAYLGWVTSTSGARVVVKAGGALNLSCSARAPAATGVSLRYRWMRGSTPLTNGKTADGAVVAGADKAALSITKIAMSFSGSYTCEVTMLTPGNDPVTTNGSTPVQVVNAVPMLSPVPTTGTISVSEPVYWQLSGSHFPTSFSATGLPAGMKLDSKTGLITGRATTPSRRNADNTDYIPTRIIFNASNAVGKGPPLGLDLVILPLDASLIGNFSGLVERSPHASFDMGGQVQLTVAPTGVVSGSAILAGQKYQIAGVMDVSLESGTTASLRLAHPTLWYRSRDMYLSVATGGMLQGGIEVSNFDIRTAAFKLGAPGQPGLVDGDAEQARLRQPSGIAMAPDGSLYMADTGNHVIRFSADQWEVTTFAGSATPGSADGTGSAASFNGPEGMALDAGGHLFVADTGNATIRKISPSGVVTTFAGSAGQFGSTNGTGSAARFREPCALCFDEAGNLYVADRGSHTLRKITPAGVVTTLAGKADMPGHKDGSGGAALFNQPNGITYDPYWKSVFVADTLNRVIRRVSLAGAVTTYAGSPGVQGHAGGLLANARFVEPRAICSDGYGSLLVGDRLLVRINRSGEVGTISRAVDEVHGTDHPVAIAWVDYSPVSPAGLIAVHDTMHSVVIYEWHEAYQLSTRVEARHQSWSMVNPVAPAIQGLYNAAVKTTATPGDVTLPQGAGYAQLSISKTGTAVWAGKAADGASFTCSSSLDDGFHIPLHASLYGGTGSLQGEGFIDPATQELVNATRSAFDWFKIPQPLASKDRSYTAGFPRHALILSGGKYVPNNIHSHLGFSPAGNPGALKLDFDGFQQTLALTAPNAVSVPANDRKLTLKIDPKTGIFSGSYKEVSLAVTVPYGGILTGGEVKIGLGHQIVPESSLPAAPIRSAPVTLAPDVAP